MYSAAVVPDCQIGCTVFGQLVILLDDCIDKLNALGRPFPLSNSGTNKHIGEQSTYHPAHAYASPVSRSPISCARKSFSSTLSPRATTVRATNHPVVKIFKRFFTNFQLSNFIENLQKSKYTSLYGKF